jgi:tetratricopeptide (TPR) repeat protein
MKSRTSQSLAFAALLCCSLATGDSAVAQETPQAPLETARLILRQVNEQVSASPNDGTVRREEILARTAVMQARACDFEAALKTAQPLSRGRAEIIMQEIIRWRAQSGDFEGARQWADAHRKERDYVLFVIAKAQADRKAIPDAMKTIAEIRDREARDAALTWVVYARIEDRALQEAAHTADTIQQKYPKGKALRGVVSALRRAGQKEASLELRKRLVELTKSLRGEEQTYLQMSLAVEMARAGDYAEATTLASGIKDIEPRRVSSGGFTFLSQGVYGLRERVLCQIALEQARTGDYSGAIQTIRDVKDVVPEPVTRGNATFMGKGIIGLRAGVLRQIVELQITAGQLPAALDTISQIPAATYADRKARRSALNTAAIAQWKAGQTDAGRATFARSLQVAEAENDVDVAYEVIAEVAEAQLRAGDREAGKTTFQRAIQQAEKVKRVSTTYALCQLAKLLHQCGEQELARTVLAQTKQHAANAENERQYIAWAQIEMEDYAGALSTAESVVSPEAQRNLLFTLAQAQAKAGQHEQALKWAETRPPSETRLNTLLGVAEGILNRLFPEPKQEKEWEWEPE